MNEGTASGRAGTRWLRADNVLWRDNLDQVVLAPPHGGEPRVLPITGALVWDLLASPVTTASVVQRLSEWFGADPLEVERDVRALLDDLEAQGFVRCMR
jgi:hypothetical protein